LSTQAGWIGVEELKSDDDEERRLEEEKTSFSQARLGGKWGRTWGKKEKPGKRKM